MKQIKNEKIYWTLFKHDQWKMYLAATVKGLCYVGSYDKGVEPLTSWAKSTFEEVHLEQNDEKLEPYIDEFKEYFEQKRNLFTFPVDLHGTDFQLLVWNALLDIPYGETFSYSQLASNLQRPNAVRAVASAIGANPVLMAIPCHRVIGKNGELRGYRGGIEMKKQLLELEKPLIHKQLHPCNH
ncbi:methylated-DNA--[protein]-cysteine S-methyltransferase [Siminovitchia fordii]|uniref:Methylated-DNA--[protein]-cysteine S-methyltransferase n=1 Tax=Siminovitchia fordii TaxID=254759 RepID=A0ABQ4KAN6_9BACI|nr:methylated-DNA--[protein]-cysteine S-methyltransferase [Siminovitchia fordii]GIN21928.1 methylated-DNA--[protein]-cysteine S-methyltransferase [Siminovitchia fordii]